MLGPMLVHQRTQFSTFNYFCSTLIGYNKSLRDVLAFGTDGDKNLTEALGHSFPFAIQLRCFVHFQKNIEEKLRSLGIPRQVSQDFFNDNYLENKKVTYDLMALLMRPVRKTLTS